jgi:hypothetical protein
MARVLIIEDNERLAGLITQRQAGDARREEVAARMAALRAILKLEICSHVVRIDANDHGKPGAL